MCWVQGRRSWCGCSKAPALVGLIPDNANYVLAISGGTLGLQTQSFSIPSPVYPNVPYLTGGSFATAQQFPAGVATTLTWNSLIGSAPAGFVSVGIDDRANVNSLWEVQLQINATSATVPANALNPNDCHRGYVVFAQGMSVPAGGFGSPGLMLRATGTDIEFRTWPYPTPPCSYQLSYGVGCDGLDLSSSDPILGTNWNLTTTGIMPSSLAVTLFSFGPQEPALPLTAFGLPASLGCSSYVLVPFVANLGGLAPSGTLSVNVAVPSIASYGGLMLYAQTVALAPSGSYSTSNAIEAFLGS